MRALLARLRRRPAVNVTVTVRGAADPRQIAETLHREFALYARRRPGPR